MTMATAWQRQAQSKRQWQQRTSGTNTNQNDNGSGTPAAAARLLIWQAAASTRNDSYQYPRDSVASRATSEGVCVSLCMCVCVCTKCLLLANLLKLWERSAWASLFTYLLGSWLERYFTSGLCVITSILDIFSRFHFRKTIWVPFFFLFFFFLYMHMFNYTCTVSVHPVL